jgi:hypothetical protein
MPGATPITARWGESRTAALASTKDTAVRDRAFSAGPNIAGGL